MITYQREQLFDIRSEIEPMFYTHWMEIGAFDKEKTPLSIDWDRYKILEENDNLFMFTVRDNKKLVGYYVAFIINHMHYNQTFCANCDIIYLDPKYRKGMIGYKLIKKSEKMLISLGVTILVFSFKADKSLVKLMERLGYKPLDVQYYKEI